MRKDIVFFDVGILRGGRFVLGEWVEFMKKLCFPIYGANQILKKVKKVFIIFSV